jgi:hypothetical protein
MTMMKVSICLSGYVTGVYMTLAEYYQTEATTGGEEIESGEGEALEHQDAGIEEETFTTDEDDSPWYYGKAKDEYRRKGSLDHRRAHDREEDPIQVCCYSVLN